MAILKVAHMGHPVLRKVSRELTAQEIKSDRIKGLINDMIDTMREYKGIGLAAPQVHESIQLCLVEIEAGNPRYEVANQEMPLKVIINPKITTLSNEVEEMWEGCLSVPGLRGLVRRPNHIRLQALDENGKSIDWELKGLVAVVVQHETDHLFGKLYIDKLVDSSKLAFMPEFEKYWAHEPQLKD